MKVTEEGHSPFSGQICKLVLARVWEGKYQNLIPREVLLIKKRMAQLHCVPIALNVMKVGIYEMVRSDQQHREEMKETPRAILEREKEEGEIYDYVVQEGYYSGIKTYIVIVMKVSPEINPRYLWIQPF